MNGRDVEIRWPINYLVMWLVVVLRNVLMMVQLVIRFFMRRTYIYLLSSERSEQKHRLVKGPKDTVSVHISDGFTAIQ